MPRGHMISALLWLFDGKTGESDKVSHNMTQIASVLAVDTFFLSAYGLEYLGREGGGLYARQKYLCRNLSQ